MSDLINLEPWWRFAVALLIGALIGLEREFGNPHVFSHVVAWGDRRLPG
ncbi:MAG: hypothetical protein P8Y98_10570 [Anaerolineales bacterium]